jgi:hypothetical protein
MPRHSLSRTARRVAVRAGRRLIVVERLVKSAVLAIFATSLLTVGREGYLRARAVQAQEQLNLAAGHGLIVRLLQSVLG